MHHGVKGMKWGVRKDRIAITNAATGATHIGVKGDGPKPDKLEKKGANANGRAIADGLINEFNTEAGLKVLDKVNSKHAAVVDKPTPEAIKAYDEDMGRALTKMAQKHVPAGHDVRVYADYRNRGVWLVHGSAEAVKTFNDDMRHADDIERVDLKMVLGDDGLLAGLELPELEHSELMHHGIKGMKWGIRRSSSQLRAEAAKRGASTSTESPSGEHKKVVGAASGETSSARYNRLREQARTQGANSLDEQDLKFLNARADALAKVQKMNETQPGWLSATTKKVLQQTAQNGMQDIADGVRKKYITGPVLDAINKKD